MILFHEPAHLKHISLEKWHHHFISCSRSLKGSKNNFEAQAKGRKQKKQLWQQNDYVNRYIVQWLPALILTGCLAPVDVAFVSFSSPNDSLFSMATLSQEERWQRTCTVIRAISFGRSHNTDPNTKGHSSEKNWKSGVFLQGHCQRPCTRVS